MGAGPVSAAGQHPVPAPCPRCTGYGDAHYLTCPTLRYSPWTRHPAWLKLRLAVAKLAEDEAAVPP